MEKNNYIIRLYHPKKKSKTNIFKSENESNSLNDHNSRIIMNQNRQEKQKKIKLNKCQKHLSHKNHNDIKKLLNFNNNIITKYDISNKKNVEIKTQSNQFSFLIINLIIFIIEIIIYLLIHL